MIADRIVLLCCNTVTSGTQQRHCLKFGNTSRFVLDHLRLWNDSSRNKHTKLCSGGCNKIE